MILGGWLSENRRTIVKILQYLIGFVILWWVVRTIEWGNLLSTVGSLSTMSLALVVIVSLAALVSQFGTWHALTSQVSDYRLFRIIQVDLVVRFVNSLLPSRVSGRSFAPVAIRHYTGGSWADATAVAMAHTGLYAICYALVTGVGIAVGAARFSSGLLVLLAIAGMLYLGAGAIIVFAGIVPDPFLGMLGTVRAASRFVPVVGDRFAAILDPVIAFIRNTSVPFRALLQNPWAVSGFVVGWTAALVVFPAVRFWLLLSGFGVQFEPVALLPIYLVTAYSVTVVPVTPAGIGITEATTVAVFIALGLPREAVVAAVLIDRVLGVYLPALAGWFPLMRANLWPIKATDNGDL